MTWGTENLHTIPEGDQDVRGVLWFFFFFCVCFRLGSSCWKCHLEVREEDSRRYLCWLNHPLRSLLISCGTGHIPRCESACDDTPLQRGKGLFQGIATMSWIHLFTQWGYVHEAPPDLLYMWNIKLRLKIECLKQLQNIRKSQILSTSDFAQKSQLQLLIPFINRYYRARVVRNKNCSIF